MSISGALAMSPVKAKAFWRPMSASLAMSQFEPEVF
jgi:hypothetical protein